MGRPVLMTSQKRWRIERSMRAIENAEPVQLQTHMPQVISARRRCAFCSTKEEATWFVLSVVWLSALTVVFLCIIRTFHIKSNSSEALHR